MDLTEHNQDNVEDKIRRALQGPELGLEDSSDSIQPVLIRAKKVQLFSFAKLVKLTVFTFLLSTIYLIRSDASVNLLATGFILKTEKALGTDLSILKTIFSVRYKLNADEFSSAVKKGSNVLASILLDWGLDPNSIDSTGDTLLITALKQRNREIASDLLNRRANTNLSNTKGELPMEFALPNADLVSLLVKAGADINGRDLSQKTYLIKAASQNDLTLIKALVQAGADPNLQDSLGKTALHYAFESKNKQNIDFLKSAGADQNVFDKSGNKAIKTVAEQKPTQDSWWQDPTNQEKQAIQQEPQAVQSQNNYQSPKMTAVRVMGKVVGVFERGKQVILKEVTADVRNVGDFEASAIRVKVKIPGGSEIELTGPATMSAYTTAKFSAKPEVSITRAGDLRATASCENCHR